MLRQNQQEALLDVNTNFCHILHHFRVISPFRHFGPVLRTFLKYLIVFCRRPERAGDAILGRFEGPLVLDKRVKFRDPSLNCSREIPPEAIGSGIFDCLSPVTFERK